MRRKQRALSETDSRKLLGAARHVTLASTTAEGEPVLRELNPVLVGKKLVFHGAHAGEKALCIGRRGVVAFSREIVDIPSYFTDPYNACPATVYFESVLAKGTLVNVEDLETKAALLESLMHHLQPEGGHAPIEATDPRYLKELRAVRVFALEIEELTGKVNLGQDKPKETVERIVEGLWRRGGPRDVAAIARIIALSPDGSPARFDLPNGFRLHLVPTKALLEEAAKMLGDTYWRKDQPADEIIRSHENSTLWLGATDESGRLVGFLRGMSDTTWRATLMDVFVAPEARGVGLGRRLVELFLDHPAIRNVRNVGLETRDKTAFYEHLGFSLHVPRFTAMKWTGRESGARPALERRDALPGAREHDLSHAERSRPELGR